MMTNNSAVSLVAILAAGLTAASAATISVTVSDAAGNALPDAAVTLIADRKIQAKSTDQDALVFREIGRRRNRLTLQRSWLLRLDSCRARGAKRIGGSLRTLGSHDRRKSVLPEP